MKKAIFLPVVMSLPLLLVACASNSQNVQTTKTHKPAQAAKTVQTQPKKVATAPAGNNECNTFPDKALCERAYSGDSKAQYAIATEYMLGDNVKQSSKKAFSWFVKSAEGGVADSQYVIALLYGSGDEGIEKSIDKSAFWHQKAAEQGHPEAMLAMFDLYKKGNGVSQSDKEAITWLKKAAKAGNIEAQRFLGMSYIFGIEKTLGMKGLFKSETEGKKWLKLAAEQGDKRSQFVLDTLNKM